ncbi:hypothetical protein EYF80_042672 [Liparis tanakae]|uniref:Uncharacterized protein n=1 Tax=Liparis tanakae TaxID=230148 RepID=A0A4Z2G0M2_9TELE|nr:hypothetical protein EYF80_042672 [Liparis tanakae]
MPRCLRANEASYLPPLGHRLLPHQRAEEPRPEQRGEDAAGPLQLALALSRSSGDDGLVQTVTRTTHFPRTTDGFIFNKI